MAKKPTVQIDTCLIAAPEGIDLVDGLKAAYSEHSKAKALADKAKTHLDTTNSSMLGYLEDNFPCDNTHKLSVVDANGEMLLEYGQCAVANTTDVEQFLVNVLLDRTNMTESVITNVIGKLRGTGVFDVLKVAAGDASKRFPDEYATSTTTTQEGARRLKVF